MQCFGTSCCSISFFFFFVTGQSCISNLTGISKHCILLFLFGFNRNTVSCETHYILLLHCSKPSEWTLEQAKRRVEEEYLVVGIAEDFDVILNVLEKLAPDLFHGIVAEYQKGSKSKCTRILVSLK